MPANSTLLASLRSCSYGGRAEPLSHVPQGWDEWHALNGNSVFYNYSMSVNGEVERHGDNYHDDYLPDLVTNRSLTFIEESVGKSEPFFLYASTPAPHEPADAAPQYQHLFQDLKAPRTPGWNHSTKGEERNYFVETSGLNGPMNESMVGYSDIMYRRRIQALQSVDEMLERIFGILEKHDLVENTYVVYASDNGFHLGQWGMALDKRLPYEHDTRVPLYARGPGIAEGAELSSFFALNIDIFPTFLDMAGVKEVPKYIDGRSLLPHLLTPSSKAKPEPEREERVDFLIEYNGEGQEVFPFTGCPAYKGDASWKGAYCHMVPMGPTGEFHLPPYYGMDPWCSCQDATNNTYSCVRILDIPRNRSEMYCEWDTGEIEMYDLIADPWNMKNLKNSLDDDTRSKLSSRLDELRHCKGDLGCAKNYIM